MAVFVSISASQATSSFVTDGPVFPLSTSALSEKGSRFTAYETESAGVSEGVAKGVAMGVEKGVAQDEANEANESCLYRLQMASIARAVIHFFSTERAETEV